MSPTVSAVTRAPRRGDDLARSRRRGRGPDRLRRPRRRFYPARFARAERDGPRTWVSLAPWRTHESLVDPPSVPSPTLVRRRGPRLVVRGRRSRASASCSAHDAEAKALLGAMTLDEKIGQMTQAEQDQLVGRGTSRPTSWARCSPAATPTPRPEQPRRTGRTCTTRYQTQALQDAPQDPDPLRRRRRARPQQRARRRRLPAQHRPRGDARRRSWSRRSARITARGGAGHRHPVGVRALRRGGARRALGPHLRELRGGPGAGGRAGGGGGARAAGRGPRRTRCACSPAPSTTSGDGGTAVGHGAAPRRRQGARPLDQGDTRLSEAELRRLHLAGLPHGASRPGVGSIMPSYNSWNGEKASGSKRLLTEILKDGAGLRGLPDLRLQRARRSCPATTAPRSSSRSTRAWTW